MPDPLLWDTSGAVKATHQGSDWGGHGSEGAWRKAEYGLKDDEQPKKKRTKKTAASSSAKD